MKQSNKILHDALLQNNVISASDIKTYASSAETAGISLKNYLLQNEIVNSRQILIALSQSLNLDIVNFKNLTVDPSVIAKVPVKIAWYYKILPLRMEENILYVASAQPLGVSTLDELRMHVGSPIKVALADEQELMEAFKKYYGFASDTIDRILSKEKKPFDQESPISISGQWIEDLESSTEDPTVSNLVNEIILEAYNKRATDIHIEPYRDNVRFRYRIDGVLVDANLPQNVKHFLSPILSRIKILANLSITEKRIPQDGSAVVKVKDQQLDLRISTMPTPRGESMVIRILPSKVMLFSLEKLGFNEESVGKFREMLKKPHGIIFITGPTGSGKTTTLYACLNEISSAERKIITIEDPVEYEMNGITQVQVNPKVNFNFATGLRSILRHDPDVLMVGEVRDPETAEIAIKTALTGHLVFSTLHTNDAASGITRLIDMGIEPYLVSSSVEAFVAQRLVRVICPKCKVKEEKISPKVQTEIKQSLGLGLESTDIDIYHGKGCKFCNDTGYFGRMAIYEILTVTDSIRSAILEKPRADHIKKIAFAEGLQTLRQSGWQLVRKGLTTVQEVINVTAKDQENLFEGKVTIEPTKEQAVSSGRMEQSVSKEAETVIDGLSAQVGDWAKKEEYESRIYPRRNIQISVRFQLVRRDTTNLNSLVSYGSEFPTISQDISAGGVRFVAKQLISIGTIIELKIQLGEGHKPIECLAKVCRVEEDSFQNVYNIVVYYLDISSADRAAISKFVERKVSEKNTIKQAV